MGAWSAAERARSLAATVGDAPAIIDAAETCTWAGLDRRCDAAAAALKASGVTPGQVIAVIAEPSADAVAAVLGVLRAGGVAAPVPTGLTRRELALALAVLAPSLVLHDAASGLVLAGGSHRGLEIGRALARGAESVSPVPSSPSIDPAFDPEAPAVIVLTSGTTGRPKGVVLSGRALAASADSWLEALPPATGWLLALGLGHVAGLGILWRAIARGVPVRITGRADPAAVMTALSADPPVSHASLVPAQLARLLDAAGHSVHDAAPPASLRALLLGGGPISPGLVTRAVRAGWPVVPTYGLTETGSGATALPTAEALGHPASAGRPLPGVSVTIDEPDDDGVGEILVESPAVFSGYLGEAPRRTGAAVRTGDLGRLDPAGRLYVIDRRTDRIVRGGENIAPAEVEEALLAHPAVAAVAIVGRPDPLWGHVPVAAIVLRDGVTDPGDEALADRARASLAGFKVPVAFLRLDVLPLTAGGKVRREVVRALVAGDPTGELVRPGGDSIGWRVTGSGPAHLVLLHGTVSTAAQLDRLAASLAAPGDVTVHALDRRGSGTGRLVRPRPIDIDVHVDDVVAYLDARGIGRASVVGVSFGGVVALELAARRPERVRSVVAYEPPYGLVADPETMAWFRRVADDTARAHGERGPAAAAETFLRAVAGDAAWDRLTPRARGFLEAEGDGALADSGMTGLDPDGLERIAAPVTILTGSASEPFYAPVADALAARVPGARRATLDGLTHTSPITQPGVVAAAVRACLEPTA
jgi:O-succinylbenzoic acid--CoA ligase